MNWDICLYQTSYQNIFAKYNDSCILFYLWGNINCLDHYRNLKGTCAICIILIHVSNSHSSHRYTDLQFNLISQAAVRPPTFVFFVNDAKLFPETYRRYMEKQLRAGAGFAGTPIRLLWRSRRKMGKDESKMMIIYLSITLWVAKSYLLMYLKMIRRFIYVYCP